MLEHFGVTEDTWRDAAVKDSNFLESESSLFVGRAVAALAQDPRMLERTGQLWSSWELSRAYQFTDANGRRPDWGAKATLDFSMFPSSFLDRYRTGLELQRDWLRRVTEHTARALSQLSPARAVTGRARTGAGKRREPATSTARARRARVAKGPRRARRSR